LRVLPVPALASTTVFFSRTIKPAKPPEITFETILAILGIRFQTAVPHFLEKQIDAAPNFIEQILIDRAGDNRTTGRTQQQIPSSDTHAGIGAKRTNSEPGIDRNLERVFHLSRCVAGSSGIFEIIDSDRINTIPNPMDRHMIGPAGEQGRTQRTRWQR